MNAQQGLQSELHRKRKAGRKAFSAGLLSLLAAELLSA